MNEKEFLDMIFEKSDKLLVHVIKRCIEECFHAVNDEGSISNKKLNWYNFLYKGEKLLLKIVHC